VATRYEPTFLPETTVGVGTLDELDIPYVPSDTSAGTEAQKIDRYPPWHSKPQAGHPTLVLISFSSFTYSHRAPNGVSFQLGPGSDNAMLRVAYEAQREGVQVIMASVSVARGGSTGNNTSDASYDPPNSLYDSAYTEGNGTFIPPGENPQGNATAPFADFDYPMAIKDVAWIVQKLKEDAVGLEVDPDNIVLMGSSAAGFTSAFTALSADLSAHFAAGSDTQNAQSTRIKGWIPWSTPTFMPAMKPSTSIAHAFPTIADQDIPAALLNDVYPSTTIDDTNYQWRLSPLHYADPANGVQTLAIYESPSVSKQISKNNDTITLGEETDFHGLRHGAALRDRLPSHVKLIYSPSAENYDAYTQARNLFGIEDEILVQENGNQADELVTYVIDWLLTLVGLKITLPSNVALPYGAAICKEHNIIIPTAGSYHRVLRANPRRAGPVTVQIQSTDPAYPGTEFQVRWATNPVTPTLGIFQTNYGALDTVAGSKRETLRLDIGGGELWVTHRVGTPGNHFASVLEPTY